MAPQSQAEAEGQAMTPDLEDAANALELHGESRAADVLRRLDLEQARADGRREALAGVLVEIDSMGGNDLYRRAWKKLAIRISTMLKAVNGTITPA